MSTNGCETPEVYNLAMNEKIVYKVQTNTVQLTIAWTMPHEWLRVKI